MNYFITTDASGGITGLYTDDPAYAAPPVGSIAVSQSDADLLKTGFAQYQYLNGAVTLNQTLLLATARATQSQLVSASCQAAIVAGFSSPALGTAHTYPAKPTDQTNLAANVLSSLLPNLPTTWTTQQMCATQAVPPVWGYVAHTAAQIQQVGSDGKAAILAFLIKNANLQGQIQSASTVAAVQAVVW